MDIRVGVLRHSVCLWWVNIGYWWRRGACGTWQCWSVFVFSFFESWVGYSVCLQRGLWWVNIGYWWSRGARGTRQRWSVSLFLIAGWFVCREVCGGRLLGTLDIGEGKEPVGPGKPVFPTRVSQK